MKQLFLIFLVFFFVFAKAQNFGSFASGIKINNTIYNCTANGQPNQIDPSPTAQNFDGLNLGTFGQNSTCINITAGEIKTFKEANANVCSARMYWRTYLAGSPTGAFNTVNLTTISECNVPAFTFFDGFGPCTVRDQKWKDYSLNINFVAGLTPGNYVLEVYYDYSGSDTTTNGCETTKFISNFGANFKANFIINRPTTTAAISTASICQGQSFSLTAGNGSNGISPYTYAWSGPNGYSSSLQNPNISNAVPAQSGIYNLFVTDACGASSTVQNTTFITINPKTNPNFAQVAPICLGGNLTALPITSSNSISGSWSPALNNVQTTTYTFTPNAAECANLMSMTIVVNPKVNPNFTQVPPLCLGTNFASNLPTTSPNGISGSWTPALNNLQTTTYTFVPNASECANQSAMTIVVNNSPTNLNFVVSNANNQQDINITSVVGGVAPYQYNLNNGSFVSVANFANVLPGTYLVGVKDVNGCTFYKSVVVLPLCVFPNGISVNNDSINDTFDLTPCNVRKIEFFNRYGMKVNSYENYTNQWDGKAYNGNYLPDATYFYIAELSDGSKKTGWVYVNRAN